MIANTDRRLVGKCVCEISSSDIPRQVCKLTAAGKIWALSLERLDEISSVGHRYLTSSPFRYLVFESVANDQPVSGFLIFSARNDLFDFFRCCRNFVTPKNARSFIFTREIRTDIFNFIILAIRHHLFVQFQ